MQNVRVSQKSLDTVKFIFSLFKKWLKLNEASAGLVKCIGSFNLRLWILLHQEMYYKKIVSNIDQAQSIVEHFEPL